MREPSYMIVLPMNAEDLFHPNNILENLHAGEGIRIQDADMDDDCKISVDVLVDEKPYHVTIVPTEVEVPRFFRPEHIFSEEECNKLDEVSEGLAVCIDFDDDFTKCFHDQLRMIDAMFPDILAVLDCPSEKLLSGKWISLAAASKIPPSPRYLFTVQAISGDGDEIWLHSHGMKRCGMYELEILCSTKDMCDTHYRLIETFAFEMLESEEGIKPGDAVFTAQTEGRKYIVCTAVDWKEALKFYPEATLGTEEDRNDEVHDTDTFVLMMYRNPKEEEQRIYTRIQDFDSALANNPMFMISNSETERMKGLAVERIPYMKDAFGDKDNTVIVKIGLIVDKEYWKDEDTPQREHIWFELIEVKEDSIVAKLTQEPYYVSGISEGYVGTYPYSDITDWMIFTKEGSITPDDAYRLI